MLSNTLLGDQAVTFFFFSAIGRLEGVTQYLGAPRGFLTSQFNPECPAFITDLRFCTRGDYETLALWKILM